jgi:MFS family permease
MGFVQTHLIAFGVEQGQSRMYGATLIAVMGVLSVVGGLALGSLSDRVGRRMPLAAAYALRGLGFATWLTIPTMSHPEIVLAVGVGLIGLSWAAPTSLTTAACADVWGSRSAAAIVGGSLFVMWIGHAAGTYLPGLLKTEWGGYMPAVLVNEIVALAAAAGILFLRDPALGRNRAAAGRSVRERG